MVVKTINKILKEMEDLPEFSGIDLIDVNTEGNFKNYPLHTAISQGDIDAVIVLLDSGADINAKGEEGYTPLHEAIEQGNEKIIQLLLDSGAEKLILNNDGLTAVELMNTLI